MKKHNLAFIDVETTGFDPEKQEMIELGCVVAEQIKEPSGKCRLEIRHELEYKIKPRHIETADPGALRVNGYNEADWLFAAELEQVMKDFSEKVKNCTFVAHNLAFDYPFVARAFTEAGVPNSMHYAKLDTISIAFACLHDDEKVQAFSLKALCEHFGITNDKAHTALADARATYEVYRRLLKIS